MNRLRSLTPAQWRRLLTSLVTVVVIILILLGWSVWTTLSSLPISSPLTPLSTPTPLPPTTPTVTPRPSATPLPQFEIADAGAIAENIYQARGLFPRWEIPLTFLDRNDMSAMLANHAQKAPAFPLNEQPILQALDLWPEKPGLQADIAAQVNSSAALYISEEDQLYLQRDWNGSPDDLRLQLGFGYARALSNQYGDLLKLGQEAGTFDRRLALLSLADGDALYTLFRSLNVEPNTPRARELTENVAAGVLPSWRSTTPDFDRLTRLPLKIGIGFTAAGYEESGQGALDQALQRPPRSTEQLLHPEKYLAGDEPEIIDPVNPTLPTGWELTMTETAGEALMDFALKQWNPNVISPTLSGWGGDMIQEWRAPGGAHVVLWQTTWDSSTEALHFAQRMNLILPYKTGRIRATSTPPGFPNGHWWEGSLGYAYIRRSGSRVWLLWGNHQGVMKVVATSELP